jgi:two-component system, OmpR family, sensor histidine kinase KdpD
LRGKLRIYLGAAPGVGKTFAMLDEGRRRLDRGTDVVVGYVETHGRLKTAALLEGLEVFPRRDLPYRGQILEEMDLPGLLRRAPQVVLVDELAHTNAPGVEHEKRWQDVNDLLDAGIEVISTVNLQHLESVNDVVENITGIRQRETVPDAFVRSAEQIQMVDMTPEALRRRLAHGNVYPAERIDAALTNFFRPGNLAALRELALLWLADRVDDELQSYRERHNIDHVWETRERIVVAVTGGATSERLVRRATRMAARSRSELVGVHVRSDDGLRAAGDSDLERSVELLEEFGGRFIEVVGGDVAAALMTVAQAESATQLVIGATSKSRLATLLQGSIVARCVSRARGEIDVHVISTDQEGETTAHAGRHRRRPIALPLRRVLASIAIGVVAFTLLTSILAGGGPGTLALALSAYLLVVITVAAVGGLVPGVLGALTAFLVTNWEFTAPVHTLTIANPRDLLALLSFLGAALTVSTFVDMSARRADTALRAERDARALARLARHVSEGESALPAMLSEIVQAFELRGAALRRVDRPDEPSVAVGTVSERATVLEIGEGFELAVDGRPLDPRGRELLQAVSAQLVVAIERRRLAEEAGERQSLLEADELRASLLAAVSHDLRSPLASIKTAVTTILDARTKLTTEQMGVLLEGIDAETDRLNGLVGDLLDMSRIQEGSVELVSVKVDLVELTQRAIAEAIKSADAVPSVVNCHSTRDVEVESDPILVERIICNLVLNAILHGGGDRVVVDVDVVKESATVRVIDHGPGIPREQREVILRPFQRRGDVADGRGVGLGLAIADGFADSLGGRLEIDDTPGGGCTMVLTVPLSRSQTSGSAS